MTDSDFLEELKTDAIDSAEDRLHNLDEAIEAFLAKTIDDKSTLSTLRLEGHSLKAVASSFDMKALLVLVHRFEDYFFNVTEMTEQNCKDVRFYIDRMSECLEAFVHGREVDVSQMMRLLPNKGGFNVGDVMVSEIEVMLVMAPGTATKIVTRELLECGYRMVNVASTMDAIQLIPSMRPDAVIVSRIMPELTGVDLVCALKSMPTTKDIPVALLATEGGSFANLPVDVPVLRKGKNFADDVADVFMKLGIL